MNYIASIACAACTILPACRAPSGAPAAREIRDEMGRPVRLPSRIDRIVSLAPSTTEILFAIGAGPSVVGVDRYSDFPPSVNALPKVGADVDPSLERIVALKPDAVFSNKTANRQATAEALERLGIPVFVSRDDTLDDIYRDVAALGDATGHAAEARALVDRMKARIAAVGERRRGQPPVKSLVVVWSEPLMVAGRRSHVGDLLAAAGGDNVVDDATPDFPTYSLERVVARPPKVAVVGMHADAPPPLAPLQRLSATLGARGFRIATVDGDLLFRPGPRVADGVEALDRVLHEEAPRAP